MTITARNAIRPDHVIVDAIVFGATWGDDTPSYYVVARDDYAAQKAAFVLHGAAVEIADPSMLGKHAWIGIKVASIGGVAGWGRAIVEAA